MIWLSEGDGDERELRDKGCQASLHCSHGSYAMGVGIIDPIKGRELSNPSQGGSFSPFSNSLGYYFTLLNTV